MIELRDPEIKRRCNCCETPERNQAVQEVNIGRAGGGMVIALCRKCLTELSVRTDEYLYKHVHDTERSR